MNVSKYNRIAVAFALASLVASVAAQQRLVVGIVVDQLQTDYVELLRDRFCSGGFNRLINNGVYFDNIEFDCANVDAASGTAMVMTGS